jgi:NADPH2:quinone reductase
VRAVVLRAFGPPDRLVAEDVPDPQPGPGELLVDVEAASITFVETQIRAGRPPHPRMAPALPAILGNGVGGTVAALGPGADPALLGRRVVTTTGGTGGYAERAAADASAAIVVPDGLELAAAVALLADGRTALSLVESAAPQPGEIVLVLAAGGGVGSLLVQLAHRAGAHVVAAAGSERKLALARSLGAEATVDYTHPGWEADIGNSGIDVVVDGVGGVIAAAAFGLVKPGGRIVAFGMASGSFVPAQDAEAAGVTLVRGVPLTPERSRALSAAALDEAAANRLTPTIGQTFALEQAADAHAAIESRATVGKTLLLA